MLNFSLLVLLNPCRIIVLVAIGTLSLLFVDLFLVALEADLVLAVARVEVFFHFFQGQFAHLAEVGAPHLHLELARVVNLASFAVKSTIAVSANWIWLSKRRSKVPLIVFLRNYCT